MNVAEDHVYDLKGRGENILSQNLSEDDKLLVKLRGDFGQALVLTKRKD